MRCGSPQGADAAAALDLQRDMPGRLRRRPLDHRRADASNGRSTTSSPCRTGPGRATRRSMATPISSWSPTGRPTSASICCARNSNRRRGQGERRHRRLGAPRRGSRGFSSAEVASSPTSISGPAALRVRALAACARAHPRDRHGAGAADAGRRRRLHRRRHGGGPRRPDACAVGDPRRMTARRWRSRHAGRLRASTVRHVGEPVAVVIAETREQAIDAAEASTSTTRRCRR